jgi:hypothetical protein
MKTIFYAVLFSLCIFSCKKQTDVSNSPVTSEHAIDAGYLKRVSDYLNLQMPDSLYGKLDMTSGALSREDLNWYFRLWFKGQSMEKKFVLLSTDSLGNVMDARTIELARDPVNLQLFNGSIHISSLRGELISDNQVVNGFMVNDRIRQPGNLAENATLNFIVPAAPVDDLPEVVVVGYTDGGGGGGLSLGDYLYLSGLIGSGASAGAGSGGVSGGGVSGGGSSGGVASSPITRPVSGTYAPVLRSTAGRPISVTLEDSYSKPAIDVAAYLKCFSQVPDAGASYAITIFADLPVNDDPTQFFDPYTGATGHVFLELSKANGSQSVNQFMGFTTVKAMAAMFGSGATAGKVVDNSGHKFNASLRVPVTADEFKSAMNKLQSQAAAQYDIINYNCVDFALGVMNSARGSYPLVINKYPPPDISTPISTPEALYNLINFMSRPGGPEAANAAVGSIWAAGIGHGACN